MNESYHNEHVTREWKRKTTQEVLKGFKPLTLYRLYGEKLSRERDSRVIFSELLYEKKVDPVD